MNYYGLQIHDTNGESFDRWLLCENFSDLVKQFKIKLNFYEKMTGDITEKVEPTLDDDTGEASGCFTAVNADGSLTKVIVFDYWVE